VPALSQLVFRVELGQQPVMDFAFRDDTDDRTGGSIYTSGVLSVNEKREMLLGMEVIDDARLQKEDPTTPDTYHYTTL